MNRYIFFILIVLFSSCKKTDRTQEYKGIKFREEMRNFVIGISQYAKSIDTDFSIITQNGVEIIRKGEKNNYSINSHTAYLNAINGQAQEGLFYGYSLPDLKTNSIISLSLINHLELAKNNGKKILVTDYCSSTSNISDANLKNANKGYINFTAPNRELDIIPSIAIPNENNANITNLSLAQNFLYLLNSHNFTNKSDFIHHISLTNYDVIIMDLFFHDGVAFSQSEINQLKTKANGGSRLVISYLSIGEAENYRYYWNTNWLTNRPVWLEEENPNWEGNYKVRYWNSDWQNIIYGNRQSYIKKILNAGFDGVYLDIIDAYEYFEDKN